jgi:glycosyltransferase involved in cell wall biosynthesis
LPGIGSVEALVVDDGSTDATAERARSAGAVVVSHPRRRGVGAAFQTGLSAALARGADLIASIDADGQFDPAHIPLLTEPVVSGRADFVSASRFKDPALVPKMPAVKRWGNRMMSRLISGITGQKFHDVSCGMRCYSRAAAMHLNLMGQYTYTQEVFLNLAFKNLRIEEVAVPVRGQRQHGQSRVARSILGYALNTSRIILRCYRDYQPMRFFGWIALVLFAAGAALEAFLLVHYVLTHSFSPHKWAGLVGGGMLFVAALVFLFGMIGDMLNRQRMYLEELLYERRRSAQAEAPPEQAGARSRAGPRK